LHCETEYAHEIFEACVAAVYREYNVDIHAEIVGDDGFFDDSLSDEIYAAVDVVFVDGGGGGDLRKKEFSTGDGTGNQKGEEGHIEKIVGDAGNRGDFFVIDIKHIAYAAKNIVGDADGDEYLQCRESVRGRGVEDLDEKVGVFEVNQQSETCEDGEEHKKFAQGFGFGSHHLMCEEEIDDNRNEYDQTNDARELIIKEEGDENERPFAEFGFGIDQTIHNDEKRKNVEKDTADE